MNRMMVGAAMGFMAGAALMMTATGRALRRDMQRGVTKAKQIMSDMEQNQ